MKVKNLKIAIAISLVGLILSCKDKQVTTSRTEDGRNTFGVNIDGKIWLPKQGVSVLGSPEKVTSGYTGGVFAITARKGINDEVIVLLARNVKSVGSYKLEETNDVITDGSKYYGKYVADDYFLYSGGTNKINVTKLDTINKVVSGTFEVQLKGKNKNSILNFTQGIFDVIYEN